ncbi:hypothetical protein ACDX78_13695 [Virgibacillus oceani]
MNNFLESYIKSRKKFPDWEDRRIIYCGVVTSISEFGTIEDLKIVTNHYESEEDKNERTTNAG